MTKSFPIFDRTHVNDPLEIWSKYVPESQKELVRNVTGDDNTAMTNGDQWSFGGGGGPFAGSYNPICIAGPQMNKKILPHQGMTPLTGNAYPSTRAQRGVPKRWTSWDRPGTVIPTM
jgi:hypothetical protein